jgi:hypothetical protein
MSVDNKEIAIKELLLLIEIAKQLVRSDKQLQSEVLKRLEELVSVPRPE